MRQSEILSPTFSSSARRGTIFSAATICGGGVLSLPFALQSAGLGLGLMFLVIVALASDFTIYVLISCSRRTGARTYEDVAEKAFGPWARGLTLVLLLVLTFLSVLAYTILVRDLLSSLVEGWILGDGALSWLEKNVVSTIACGMIAPACFIKHLTELKYLSVISFCSILMLALALFVRTVDCTTSSTHWRRHVVIVNKNVSDVLSGLAVLICTYLCHFNVLPVHCELRKPTRTRLHKFIHITIVATSSLYVFVGILGVLYGACTEPVAGNILNSFADDDQLVNVGKLGLAITIMLHLPMLVVPCRDTLGRIHRCLFPLQTDVNQNTDISIASREQVIPVDDADDPLAEDQLTEAFVQISAFDTESDSASTCTVKQLSGDVWLTLTVMGLDIFLAFLITDVALVWDLLGSTVSIIIAYILPCSAYIIIRRIKPITNLEMMLAWFVLVGSIVIGFVCTGNVIYKLSSQGS